MIYSEADLRKIVNNAITNAGIENAKVNGVPVGHISAGDDLSRFGAILTQPVVANAFINSLYNQFIYRATAENYFTSPFDYFRENREGFAFGSYEVDVQPIFPVPYDMKAFDRVLDFWETPAIVQYFAINRRDTFPQTITKEMVKDAFASYEALDSFLAKLVLAPRKGNIVIETNAVKMMINTNVASGTVKTKGFTKPTTREGWLDLAGEIIGIAEGMSAEPTTEYNNYANIQGAEGEAWTQSDKRDIVLIGQTDVISNLKAHTVAFAYNKEDIDFNFHYIPLNSFDFSTYNEETRKFENKVDSPIQLIICDGGWIKLEDNLYEEFSNTNSMTMGIQRALQVQQTIALRVARNAVAFIDAESELMTNTLKVIDDNPVKYLGYEDNEITIDLNGGDYDENLVVKVKGTRGLIGQTQTELSQANISTLIGFNDSDFSALTDAISDDKTSVTVVKQEALANAKADEYATIVVTINGSEFTIVTPTSSEPE